MWFVVNGIRGCHPCNYYYSMDDWHGQFLQQAACATSLLIPLSWPTKARNTRCEMTADLCEKRLHFMYWRKICRIFLLFHRSTFQNVLVFFSQICCHFQPCIFRFREVTSKKIVLNFYPRYYELNQRLTTWHTCSPKIRSKFRRKSLFRP